MQRENCTPPKEIKEVCFATNALDSSSGKWKTVILWYLKDHKLRFNEFRRLVPTISKGTLTKQLRELENDGMISRKNYNELPLKIEYSLTTKGASFIPILENMGEWSKKFWAD